MNGDDWLKASSETAATELHGTAQLCAPSPLISHGAHKVSRKGSKQLSRRQKICLMVEVVVVMLAELANERRCALTSEPI